MIKYNRQLHVANSTAAASCLKLQFRIEFESGLSATSFWQSCPARSRFAGHVGRLRGRRFPFATHRNFLEISDTSAAAIREYIGEGARDPNLDRLMEPTIDSEEKSLPEKALSVEIWDAQYRRLTSEEKEKFLTSMGAKSAVLKLYARSKVHSTYNAWSRLKALSEFVDSLIDEIENATSTQRS
jgi:hypothetical protein